MGILMGIPTGDHDDDGDGDGDDDRPGSSRSPSNAPRDQISREGTPSLRFLCDFWIWCVFGQILVRNVAKMGQEGFQEVRTGRGFVLA